jgi:hypothetical protein
MGNRNGKGKKTCANGAEKMAYRNAHVTLLCFALWCSSIPRSVLSANPDSLCLASGDGTCVEFEEGWKTSMCLPQSPDLNVPLFLKRAPLPLRILLESETWEDLLVRTLRTDPLVKGIFGDDQIIPIQESFDFFEAFAFQLETLPLLHGPVADALKTLVERVGNHESMFIMRLLTSEARDGIGNALFASKEIRASVALQWVAITLLQHQSKASSVNIDPSFLNRISKVTALWAYTLEYYYEKSKSAEGGVRWASVYRKVLEDAAEKEGLLTVKEMFRGYFDLDHRLERGDIDYLWRAVLAFSAYTVNPKSRERKDLGLQFLSPLAVFARISDKLGSSVNDESMVTVTKIDFYDAVDLELNSVVSDAQVFAEYWKDAQDDLLFGGLKCPKKVIEKLNDLVRLPSASNEKLRKTMDFLESVAVFIKESLPTFPFTDLNGIGIATPSAAIYPVITNVLNDILEFAVDFKNAKQPTISSHGMAALLKRLDDKNTRRMTGISIRKFGFVGEILDKFLTPGLNNYCKISINSMKEALAKINSDFATFPSFLKIFLNYFGLELNSKSKALMKEVLAQESEITEMYCNHINLDYGKDFGSLIGAALGITRVNRNSSSYLSSFINQIVPTQFHSKRMQWPKISTMKNPFRNTLSSLENVWETNSSRLLKNYLGNALQIVDLPRDALRESLLEKLLHAPLCEYITLVLRLEALETEVLNMFGKSIDFYRLDKTTKIMLFLATQPEMRNDVSRFGQSIVLDKETISKGAPYALKAAVDFSQVENVKFLLSSIDFTSNLAPEFWLNEWNFCNIEKFPSQVKGSMDYAGAIKQIETICKEAEIRRQAEWWEWMKLCCIQLLTSLVVIVLGCWVNRCC